MTRTRLFLATLTLVLGGAVHAGEETYTIDPRHTFPSFEAPHMGISIWRAKFRKTSGSIRLDREAKTGTVDVVIDAGSVDFGLDKMNEHAIAEDFFDVEKYPQALYEGDIRFTGDTPGSIDGKLTLHGVTKPVRLTINSFKCIMHPMLKKQVCGADASGSFNRADFGITKAAEGELGQVKLAIQVEGIKND
jgi:polyisoprenoid-binding protein YceI